MKNKSILHIWDQAGVGNIIAKYQRLQGYDVSLIMRKKFDPYEITKFYNNKTIDTFSKLFIMKCILEARKYDILHLHDAWWAIKPCKLLYPKKKILLHYHGSYLRNTSIKIREKFENICDCILLATPDLFQFETIKEPILIPTPIDVEHFSTRKIQKNNKGIIYLKPSQTLEETKNLLKSNGIDIELETFNKKVTYSEVPKFLSQYEYYVNLPIMNNKIIPAISSTGLQSLSLGMKLIDYDFKTYEKLPKKHYAENVVNIIDSLIEKLV